MTFAATSLLQVTHKAYELLVVFRDSLSLPPLGLDLGGKTLGSTSVRELPDLFLFVCFFASFQETK